ncbi:hypothetical protein TNCV_3022801 [Trichonephila clavipes]|nr:hypothetical protein TNCV_3022801 [Trichonephila clavipes]
MARQTITPGVRPLVAFDNALRNALFTGMSLTRIRPSWCHKLKRIDNWKQHASSLCTLAQCSRRRRWFCVRGILYRNPCAQPTLQQTSPN